MSEETLGATLFNRTNSNSTTSGPSLLSALVSAATNNANDPDPDKLIYLWQEGIPVPVWMPNESGVCFTCTDKLTVGSRHHCRLCGENFCSQCTGLYYVQKQFQRSKGDADAPTRVCWGCRDACLEKRDQMAQAKQPRKKRMRIRKDASGKVFIHSPSDHARNKQDTQCFSCRAPFNNSSSLNGPKPFTCRVCGEIVCHNCSTKAMPLPPSFRKAHLKANAKKKCRVCNECRYLIIRGAQIDGREWTEGSEVERTRTVSSTLEDSKVDDDHSSDSDGGIDNRAHTARNLASEMKAVEPRKKGMHQQKSSQSQGIVSKLGLFVRGNHSDDEEVEEKTNSMNPEQFSMMVKPHGETRLVTKPSAEIQRSNTKVDPPKPSLQVKGHLRTGSLKIKSAPKYGTAGIPEMGELHPEKEKRESQPRTRSSSLGKILPIKSISPAAAATSMGAGDLKSMNVQNAKSIIIEKAVGLLYANAEFDYDGKTRGSMPFSKGDRLKVIKKGLVWWLAINMTQTPRIGWIPPTFVKEEEEPFNEPFPDIEFDDEAKHA
jgi:hypothetical protein